MKVLLSTLALLTLVLASCANLPASVQENAPAVPPSEDTQGNTSTEARSGTTIEVVGGDEESLREFIRQWMNPIYPDGTSQNTTVYIGSLPDDIPYDLPTPEDSRVVGSITGSWVDYMLIFDTSVASESVQEFYAQSLAGKGWKEAPTMQGGGFTSQSDLYKAYCYEENKAFLSVETPSISAEKTSIRLNLDTSPDSYACNPDASYGASYMNTIPALSAPQGVAVQGTGAGSSDRDANVTATLKGDLAAAEVADFYNEQLSAAGWEMQNESQGEGAAWSNWTFRDEQGTDWFGALMVIETSAESDTLFAFVSIEKTK
jgi:hypothetical protein